MRLEKYGQKYYFRFGKARLYLKRFLSQLNSKLVLVLIITALLSLIVSLMYNEVNSFSPLLIIGIVIINAAVSAYHLHTCDNALNDK